MCVLSYLLWRQSTPFGVCLTYQPGFEKKKIAEGEAGKASGEPRDILRDVDDVTTVRILPSLEAADAHDGDDVGDEHMLNLRHSLHLWGYVSRIHVFVGGEGLGVLLVAVAAFAPMCLRKSKV